MNIRWFRSGLRHTRGVLATTDGKCGGPRASIEEASGKTTVELGIGAMPDGRHLSLSMTESEAREWHAAVGRALELADKLKADRADRLARRDAVPAEGGGRGT